MIAEKAKEKQAEYHGNQHDGLHQKSDKEQVTTAKELAEVIAVTHDQFLDKYTKLYENNLSIMVNLLINIQLVF